MVPYLLVAPSALFLAYFLFWPAPRAFVIAFQTAAREWTAANL